MKKTVILFFLSFSLLLTGCTKQQTKESEEIDTETLKIEFDGEDLIETYNKDEVYMIKFNGENATYTKGTLNNQTFTITEKGTYYLTGNFYGNIEVDSKQHIRLILDNVSITSKKNSPIFIKNADKIIITLAENSNNKLIDASNYSLDNDGEPNATLFSKDDLVINGTGNLEIRSNYNDAIASKDGLKIVNGNYIITSVGDGIRGKDYVLIKNGVFGINCGNDGIKTTNKDINLGNLIIENGIFNVICTGDGLTSQNSILIQNGNFNIMTGGGIQNTSSSWDGWSNYKTNDVSSKAIKAVSNILIENGKFIIDSYDDSMHSNNIIELKNGEFDLSSGNDGIHADNNLKIYDGNINIEKSYEGLESSYIYIYNGIIHINSTDDGINVAGGSDSSSTSGRPVQNQMSKESGKLQIENGYIYVDSKGDGLDANGSIYLNGGSVIVNGPTDNGNGIIDYDIEFIVSGGELVAAGSSGMLQTPSSKSTINTISVVLDSYNTSLINITDSDGNSVITFLPSKQYNAFMYASSKIKMNETYTINLNGEVTGNNRNGIYDGKYVGTLLDTVTISSTITSIARNHDSTDVNSGMNKQQRR